MEYLLLVVGSVLLTVTVIYFLATRRFGFVIPLKPFLLSAGAAVVIGLGIPRFLIPLLGVDGTLLFLFFTAVGTAYFIARMTSSCGEIAESFSPAAPSDGVQGASVPTDVIAPVARGEESEEIPPIVVQDTLENCGDRIIHDFAGAKLTDENQLLIEEGPYEPIDSTRDEVLVASAPVEEIPVSCAVADSVENADMHIAQELVEDEGESIANVFLVSTPVAEEIAAVVMEKPEPMLPEFATLDEALDFSFSARMEQKITLACEALEAAKSFCAEDIVAASSLELDHINLLRLDGQYDKALAKLLQLQTALGAWDSKEGALVKKQVCEIMGHVAITRRVLGENELGRIPLALAPKAVRQAIETEFRQWRNSYT